MDELTKEDKEAGLVIVKCTNCDFSSISHRDLMNLSICLQCKSRNPLYVQGDNVKKQASEGGRISKILNSISESKIKKSGKTKYEIAADILNKESAKERRESQKEAAAQGIRVMISQTYYDADLVKRLEKEEISELEKKDEVKEQVKEETNDKSSYGVIDQNTLDKVNSLMKEYEELDRLEKKQFSSPSNGCLFIFLIGLALLSFI